MVVGRVVAGYRDGDDRGPASDDWGCGVWQFRGSDGIGTVAASGASPDTAKTISLNRAYSNSKIVGGGFDWSAVAVTGYAWTPTVANDRQHILEGDPNFNNFTVFVADWDDQGGTGATSYGLAGTYTAGSFCKLFIEIRGAAAGGRPPPCTRPPRRSPRS